MKIFINQSTKETAECWSKQILATGLTRTPNYTNLERPGRFYFGYIGELCFRNGLALRMYRYVYCAFPNGKPDKSGSDVFVWSAKTGERLSVNVKTACEEHYRKMMVPEEQFKKYHADAYVAGHIIGDCCHFRGWLTQPELAKYPVEQVKVDGGKVVIPTRCCLFTQLHDIEGLLGRLEKE